MSIPRGRYAVLAYFPVDSSKRRDRRVGDSDTKFV